MINYQELNKYGWQAYFSSVKPEVPDRFEVGRIGIENKTNYLIYGRFGEMSAFLRGNMIKSKNFPKVGDWILFTKLPNENRGVIEKILPRKTKLGRKDAEQNTEQIMAANVDLLFIVQSLGHDFNLSRLERYLVLAKSSDTKPVVVLNKIDLKEDYSHELEQVKQLASGLPVFAMSAKTGEGIEQIKEIIEPGLTMAFVGSSGVGKSSLINAILGIDLQKTAEVRIVDGRGKHTTTKREMIVLPQGGILIDTPGMRELGALPDLASLNETFEDLEQLANQCKFRNCDHQKSEGCAIQAALEDRTLDRKRYLNFLKLKREQGFLESKEDSKKSRARKVKEKRLHKKLKKIIKAKYQ
ncbi:MAG TPA: ribosome small subunit-dependent GTPase A [Verrucomicrobiae bacterium]|nr:ribosome small subunit-dependent GTPase A [Verrucomicrobiae bacterium]